MSQYRAVMVMVSCLPILGACNVEGESTLDETVGVATNALVTPTQTIKAPTQSTTGTFRESAPLKSATAPAPLSASRKAQLVSEVEAVFSLADLEVNAEEVIEVTIDDPRIIDRAALGTRFMHWTDPQTSAVTAGYARYFGGGTQTPYARLRIDASFGELYLVDCRVTNGEYRVEIHDVSGLGGGSQSVQASTLDGHFVFAFDAGPGGYKQAYIQRTAGAAQAWDIWGCEIMPLE